MIEEHTPLNDLVEVHYTHKIKSPKCDCRLCEKIDKNTWEKHGTYYVARNGCDYCLGTEAKPFKTISYAIFMASNPRKFQKVVYELKRTYSRLKQIILGKV